MPELYTTSSSRGRWILISTIFASGSSFLMGSVVSIALPTIQRELNTSLSHLQWVVNVYLLALASLLLIGGSLGDRYGRKKVFASGIAIFGLGAALSGFAWSPESLIVFQAFQGVGAALMVPGSLTIINVCFEPGNRGKAIGLWSGISAGLASVGPFLGGGLVETWSWPAVFFFVVPFVICALIITLKFVPETRNEYAKKLDWPGAVMILLALVGISLGLIQGPDFGWSHPLVLTGLLGGAASFVAFFLIERRSSSPLVPLGIFRNMKVSGANIVTLFLYFSLNALIFFLSFNLQQIQGFSPSVAGLATLPPIILITFLSGYGGALADRHGPRRLMILGPLAVAIGMAWLAFAGVGASYWTAFLPGLILFGGGMAFVIAPLTKSALEVRDELSGVASGVNNAVARLAGLLAIAILGAVMSVTFSGRLVESARTSSLSTDHQDYVIAHQEELAGLSVPDHWSGEQKEISRQIIRQSFTEGFRLVIGISAALAFLSALVSFVTIRNRRSAAPDGQ
ncbi:MAG: MFS transporter [bacterium]|nr:MFS transporter [bacterium]